MGKKKARRGRKLKALIHSAIFSGDVFVGEKSASFYKSIEGRVDLKYHQVYEVCIGRDSPWYDLGPEFFLPIVVYVFENGNIAWHFVRPERHVLDRASSEWFSNEIAEIVTMYKLGGFCSQLPASNHGLDSSALIWRLKQNRMDK